jgi:hypothetical protein
MILLFVIEFVEGNTITRLYFMRLRRLTNEALARGAATPELSSARQEQVPTFTHFLDLPMLLLILSLGAIRPPPGLNSSSARSALFSSPRL